MFFIRDILGDADAWENNKGGENYATTEEVDGKVDGVFDPVAGETTAGEEAELRGKSIQNSSGEAGTEQSKPLSEAVSLKMGGRMPVKANSVTDAEIDNLIGMYDVDQTSTGMILCT